ncbi:MAG: collagen binding domain-containing protein [Planctomycetota bacterium]
MDENRQPPPAPESEIFERNLRALLSRAYRPVEPAREFQSRLLQAMQSAQRESSAARSRARLAVRALPAAAALLALVATLVIALRADGPPRAMPLGDGVLLLAREGAPLREVRDAFELERGDRIATHEVTRAQIIWDSGHRIELDTVSLVSLESRAHDAMMFWRGGGLVSAASDATHTLATPFLIVNACAAQYRVALSTESSAPVAQELLMNRKHFAGVAAVAVIAVTITVFVSSPDKPVEVTIGDKKVQLQNGTTAVFNAGGGVSQSAPAAPTATGATAKPPVVAVPEGVDLSALVEVRGVVEDRDQKPVRAARVVFKSESESTAVDPLSVSHAVTEDDGRFVLRVAKAARGAIEASCDRHVTATMPWPIAEAESGGATTTATAEEPSETSAEKKVSGAIVDAAVEPDVRVVLDHETAIAGIVVDATGNPVPKCLVGIQIFYDVYRRGEPVVREFESADGSYYFGGIEAGSYRVWAYEVGYQRTPELKVEVADHQFLRDVNMTLEPGNECSGVVFDKRTRRPVADAIVYPHLEHLAGTVEFFTRSAVDPRVRNAKRTEGDGAFALADLPTGRVLLRVLHPDYQPIDRWVEVSETGPNDLEFELEEGTGFRGRVLDTNGEPMVGATILAVSMNLNPDLAQTSWDPVDADGNYHIRNLNPGAYVMVWIKNMAAVAEEDATVVKMATLKATEDTILDFNDVSVLATVHGQIKDEGGTPVAGVAVTLTQLTRDPDTGRQGYTFESATTNSDGTFEIRNLKLGKWTVALARGYSQSFGVATEIDCSAAEDYQVDLTLYELTFRGVVRDALTQAGVPETEIIVLGAGSDGKLTQFSGRALTDEKGAYNISSMAPGKYRLLSRSSGYRQQASAEVELDLELKDNIEVNFELSRGAAVHVLVFDENGAPVPDAQIHIVDSAGVPKNMGLQQETGNDGAYRFSSLDPGAYTIRVIAEGREPTTADCKLDVGAPTVVRITAPRKAAQ